MPAPAKDAVRYETKVFSAGFGGDKGEYMGPPTKENRLAWDRLYQGITFSYLFLDS